MNDSSSQPSRSNNDTQFASATNNGFKPWGLKWKSNPSNTSRQLE